MAVLVPSTRLPDKSVDNRQDRRYPVARKSISVTVLDTTNTITLSNVELNGYLTEYFIASPAIPTDTQFTMTLTSEGIFQTYTKADHADNSTSRVDVSASNFYLVGKYDITISFTTALSGNSAVFDVWFNLARP